MVILRLAGKALECFIDPDSAPAGIRLALPQIWGVLDHIRVSWRGAPRHGSGRFLQWVNLPSGKVIGIVLSVGQRDHTRRMDTIIVHDFTVV